MTRVEKQEEMQANTQTGAANQILHRSVWQIRLRRRDGEKSRMKEGEKMENREMRRMGREKRGGERKRPGVTTGLGAQAIRQETVARPE